MLNQEQLINVGKWVVKQEARVDKAGNPMLYKLPANDGGGNEEICGFNDRFNPEVLKDLKALLAKKDYEGVWNRASEEIIKDTDSILRWNLELKPSHEVYLRDSIFNRGFTGASKILQLALGVTPDGIVGPKTKEAYLNQTDEASFLLKIRVARETYENKFVGYRANLIKGLTNRWNNALVLAKTFL